MRKAIILSSLFFISLISFGQKQSLELQINGRYGVLSRSKQWSYNDTHIEEITTTGTSTGLALNYKISLGKNLYGRFGTGYNRLNITKLENKSEYGPVLKDRQFDPQHDDGYAGFSATGKYHYHNIMFSAGISYEKNYKKNIKFTLGGDIVYRHTLAQCYYYGTSKDAPAKLNDRFPLALGLNARTGLLYRVKGNKLYLHPELVLPVYQRMFADKTLLENNYSHRPQKWLGSPGLSITMGIHL